jgi:hypothetical protein
MQAHSVLGRLGEDSPKEADRVLLQRHGKAWMGAQQGLPGLICFKRKTRSPVFGGDMPGQPGPSFKAPRRHVSPPCRGHEGHCEYATHQSHQSNHAHKVGASFHTEFARGGMP